MGYDYPNTISHTDKTFKNGDFWSLRFQRHQSPKKQSPEKILGMNLGLGTN
jgi:hypothetical protein